MPARLIGTSTTPSSSYTQPSQYITGGNTFNSGANEFTVTGLSWYRASTSGPKPTALVIWDVGLGSVVTQVVPTDSSGTGWKDTTISPVTLAAARNYIVGWYYAPTFTESQISGAPLTDYPLVYVNSLWSNASGSTMPLPATGHTGAYVVSVIGDPITIPENIAQVGDITNQLNDYLATGSDNTHPDALPNQTKIAVDAISSTVSATAGVVDAIRSSQEGNTSSLSDLWSLAGRMTDAEFALWNWLTGKADTKTAGVTAPPTWTIDDRLADLATRLSGLDLFTTARLNAIVDWQIDVLGGRAGFPTGTTNTAWTQQDQTDFDTELAWAVPADLYVVNITSVPAGVSTTTFAGLTFHHRLGSWCVLNGTLGSSRRFLEFANQACDDGGRRMAGFAMRCKRGTIGTVQAWTLAPTGG